MEKEHHTGLIYGYYDVIIHGKSQTARYVGETSVRVGTRVAEHANSKASAIFKYVTENHLEVTLENFDIIEKGYP